MVLLSDATCVGCYICPFRDVFLKKNYKKYFLKKHIIHERFIDIASLRRIGIYDRIDVYEWMPIFSINWSHFEDVVGMFYANALDVNHENIPSPLSSTGSLSKWTQRSLTIEHLGIARFFKKVPFPYWSLVWELPDCIASHILDKAMV